PVRILVSTAVHLIPGIGFFGRNEYMQNLISQYHWKRDFEDSDRFLVYNTGFSSNRRCYFLLDHGQSPDDNDEAIPILMYWWTGESLEARKLPFQIRRILAKVPFTPQPIPRPQPHQIGAVQRREYIKEKLCYEMGLLPQDFDFLKEYPEHMDWLKKNTDNRIWSRFKIL
ncbi:hypothetical protein B0T24DRAFT_511652, partial [Lasiosphaeria ovina]